MRKPHLVLTGQKFVAFHLKDGLQMLTLFGRELAGGMERIPAFVVGQWAYELRDTVN